MIGGARNAHQARDALAIVVKTALRWLTSVALALHTRVGDRPGLDGPAADVLRDLRRRELADDEWKVLLRELVRGLGAETSGAPVPELVALFANGDGDGDGGVPWPSDAASDRLSGRAEVERLVPAITKLLGRAGLFLSHRQHAGRAAAAPPRS